MLRIVGGELSGRRFAGPVGSARPTSERVREALGSALEARSAVRGSVVLDLFAGTGALGFEMLSRGAARAVLVDRDRRAIRQLAASARELGLSGRVVVLDVDLSGPAGHVAVRLAERGPFDLVLADAPWADVDAVPPLLAALAAAGALAEDALLVIEHATRRVPTLPDGLATEATYRYGDTAVIIAHAVSLQERSPT